MSKKEEVVRLRLDNPLMTAFEISKQVGIHHSYVYHILNKQGLHTAPPRKKTLPRQCLNCQTPLEVRRRFCSPSCKDGYIWITVKCTFCHVLFKRKRSYIECGVKMEYNNLYCSRICFQKRNT